MALGKIGSKEPKQTAKFCMVLDLPLFILKLIYSTLIGLKTSLQEQDFNNIVYNIKVFNKMRHTNVMDTNFCANRQKQ